MTLTLYPASVVISCDHPECGNEVVSAGAGDARSLAKAHGWRQAVAECIRRGLIQ